MKGRLLKRNLDLKLARSTTKRFLVRIGVYGIFHILYERGYCVYTMEKHNLYYTRTNKLFRAQICSNSDESVGVRMNSESVSSDPLFHVEPSREENSLALHCWLTHSKFVVYVRSYFTEWYSALTNSQHYSIWYLDRGTIFRVRWNNWQIYQHIVYARRECDYDDSRCLILSWFDRVDRMIFSKYLSKCVVDSEYSFGKRFLFRLKKFFSRSKKNDISPSSMMRRNIELSVFITEYL
jgi:hypothetical protein